MISTGELKKGATIEMDGKIYSILDYDHIKMGRGSAQVRMKLRDIRSGSTIEHTVQAGTKFQRARVERRPMEYLYNDGTFFYFMNNETFEQMPVGKDIIGDSEKYLKENTTCEVMTYEDQVIGVDLPITVELAVTHTEPGFKGDTAQGGSKPATLETGLQINVPMFINEGDVLRINTETGQYTERVSS
jgi:elongation factor P